jgi:hypothetical protein
MADDLWEGVGEDRRKGHKLRYRSVWGMWRRHYLLGRDTSGRSTLGWVAFRKGRVDGLHRDHQRWGRKGLFLLHRSLKLIISSSEQKPPEADEEEDRADKNEEGYLSRFGPGRVEWRWLRWFR